MAGTRSSARLSQNASSPPSNSTETKRKADDSQSSPSKRGRKNTGEQKTIEETMNLQKTEDNESDKKPTNTNDTEMKDDKLLEPNESFRGTNKEGEPMSDPEKALKDSRPGQGLNTLDIPDKDHDDSVPHDDVHAIEHERSNEAKETKSTEEPKTSTQDNGADTSKPSTTGDAVEESKERADKMPSNILEKGIIYFFTRGRVGVDEPHNVQDLQRSFFVLRPLPQGAKLNDGPIQDHSNNRLIALPKKVFPKSPSDKFMVFVEKAKASMDQLKQDFLQGSEYQTQTAGPRTQSPMTPIGEGVYAITATGTRAESHLAYMLTIPQTPGEMQNDVGILNKGSFVMSLKNPTVKGPSYATLDQPAEFPKEMIDEFNGRGWMPAQPKHLDYANAQILLIGEALDESHALEATEKDKKDDDKETPMQEIEKLEHEDEMRVEHLKGDDTVFEDLGLSHKEYPSVPTTW